LTLWKIIKIVGTRFQILRLKFNFGWGSAPDPAVRAYSAPPDPIAGLRGLLLRERREREGERRGDGKGGGGEGRWEGKRGDEKGRGA